MSASRSFVCRACGACCRWGGHVLLDDDDITDLAAAMNMPEPAFISKYTELARNRQQLSLINRPDGACIFLEGDRCGVYDHRPEQCRAFPHEWSVPGCPAMES